MNTSVNLLLFNDTITEPILDWFPRLREIGFEGIEVPVFQPDHIPIEAIRSRARDADLRITISGALPPGASFYHADHARKAAAETYIRGLIGVSRELEAGVICGPLCKPVGDFDESIPLEQQRERCADEMRPLAREAAEHGLRFAIEPLNRYETNLLNLTEQGIAFCRMVDSPGLGLLLDTYHMHIEEKSTATAIRAAAAAGCLTHFHASENDRGIAGSGQVGWEEVAAALREVGYDGWQVLESFSQTNQAIKTAVSCWRPFFPSEREFVELGYAFVSRTLTGGAA